VVFAIGFMKFCFGSETYTNASVERVVHRFFVCGAILSLQAMVSLLV
jgi:hypothetical protein